ncbi:MAG: Uma2 family endonuclease, partial [Desulfobacterales bacterium]
MSPSYSHAAISAMLITEISKDRRFRAFSELTLLIDGKDYIPDISVYPWRKMNYLRGDIVKMTELPVLVMEILSPMHTALELYEKAQNVYLPAGIPSVWIVLPLAHTISVLTKDNVRLYHEGRLEDAAGVA